MTRREEVKNATVHVAAEVGFGTGFFIDKDRVLTCAHVIDGKPSLAQNVSVRWHGRSYKATVIEKLANRNEFTKAPVLFPDLALLRVAEISDGSETPDSLSLGSGLIESGDPFFVFGYSGDGSRASDVTATFEGYAQFGTSQDGRLIKCKGGQFEPGMSGAAVLNERNSQICGIAALTRDPTTDLGGMCIPASTIFWHFGDLHQGTVDDKESDSKAKLSPFIFKRPLPGKVSDDWMICYAGEKHTEHLRELVNCFSYPITYLADDKPRKARVIESRFAYLGTIPAVYWTSACLDPVYYMKRTINDTGAAIAQLAPLQEACRTRRFCYASLGAGEGLKDARLLSRLKDAKCKRPLYIPIDMSIDLLRIAASRVWESLGEGESDGQMVIWRNFESQAGMEEIADIVRWAADGRPVLFGLLGNTLANVEHGDVLLKRIASIMKPDDLLVLEAWYVEENVLKSKQRWSEVTAKLNRGYRESIFRDFALSGLRQHTDLPIGHNDYTNFEVEVYREDEQSSGEAIVIDCLYQYSSDSGKTIRVFRDDVYFGPKETIRVYRSRRYAEDCLERMINNAGFESVAGDDAEIKRDGGDGTGFKVFLLRLQR